MVGVDYAFLTKTGDTTLDTTSLTTLVAKDSQSKCMFGIAVPKKGVNDVEYATRMLIRALNFLGYPRVIMKSDQEAASVKVLEHVRDHKGSDVLQLGIEHSPAHDHQSNGLVERAVQTLEGHIRSMILALEHNIDANGHVLPWLISDVGVIINRFYVAGYG